MLSAALVAQIERSSWFNPPWAPYLIVDADLRIRAVNQAYEQATAHPRSWLTGERLFDVFPDNPAEPAADGVANLSDSLDLVFSRGTRHWMGVQRYDVPDLMDRRAFVHKVWVPVNSPIKDGGKTVAVLHHVQDVTTAMSRLAGQCAGLGLGALQAAAEALWREFPGMSREAVLGTLTDSCRVVIETLGAPDPERVTALARLRLEIRAGHPSPASSQSPHAGR